MRQLLSSNQTLGSRLELDVASAIELHLVEARCGTIGQLQSIHLQKAQRALKQVWPQVVPLSARSQDDVRVSSAGKAVNLAAA